MKFSSYAVPLAGIAAVANAIELTLNDKASVNSAMSLIAHDMMTYYVGNLTGGTPGILPGPCESDLCYYWWQAGAMWGGLINYAQYTGDTSYNPVVLQALEWQIGPDKNYNPPNQSKNMGIDDQDFWGFAAMEAAEAGIPDSKTAGVPSWLALAQAVFNFQASRWDTGTCGGGFRWQVYSFNAGYNLKNTISNGGFFNLAARLARYTGNDTYADWAEKVYSWMESTPLFQHQDGYLYLWDNTDANTNCTKVENYVWSYNYGTLLFGAAMLYNHTNGGAIWKQRIDDLLKGAFMLFYPQTYEDNNSLGGNTMVEMLCEDVNKCDNDQSSFKAYLARWLGIVALLAPYTAPQIQPKITATALAAAKQCSGGDNGRWCGRKWYHTAWDGSKGVGQQMSALAAIGATQLTAAMVPLTAATGGNSVSDPGAGGDDTVMDPTKQFKKITTADRAGAAIITILAIGFVVGLSVWIVL